MYMEKLPVKLVSHRNLSCAFFAEMTCNRFRFFSPYENRRRNLMKTEDPIIKNCICDLRCDHFSTICDFHYNLRKISIQKPVSFWINETYKSCLELSSKISLIISQRILFKKLFQCYCKSSIYELSKNSRKNVLPGNFLKVFFQEFAQEFLQDIPPGFSPDIYLAIF